MNGLQNQVVGNEISFLANHQGRHKAERQLHHDMQYRQRRRLRVHCKTANQPRQGHGRFGYTISRIRFSNMTTGGMMLIFTNLSIGGPIANSIVIYGIRQ